MTTKERLQDEYSSSPQKVNVLTIDDPKGAEIFNKLSEEAKVHLRTFGLSRPGFDIVLHGSQIFDEEASQFRTKPPEQALENSDGQHRQSPIHQYQAGTIYTVGMIRREKRLERLEVIDIGSSIEQNIAVAAIDNVRLTVIDVRPAWNPTILPFQHITANATKIPLPDCTADVVTSNCVMCHVGDGRYGDPYDVDGDVNMLREVKRILKKGRRAYIGLGPMHKTANILFNIHRVYSEEWARKLFKWAGLRPTDFLVYNLFNGEWCTPDLMDGKVRGQYYGFVALERPAW